MLDRTRQILMASISHQEAVIEFDQKDIIKKRNEAARLEEGLIELREVLCELKGLLSD